MTAVTVEIGSGWVNLVRSPAFTVISALTGVSVAFAPYYLYLSALGKFHPGYEKFTVPLLFALIYLVPGVYEFSLTTWQKYEATQEPRTILMVTDGDWRNNAITLKTPFVVGVSGKLA